MARRQPSLDALLSRVSELSVEVKHIRMVVYLMMLIMIFLLILVILSLTYADSYNPMSLFFTSDRTFSFSGNPLSATIHTKSDNYLYADMIENGSVFVSGRAMIRLKPDGPIVMIPDQGDRWTIAGPVTVDTDGGSAGISVGLPVGSQSYYNNSHFYFSDANVSFDHRGPNYNLILSSAPGTVKSYDNLFIAVDGGSSVYSFLNYITLKTGNFTVRDANGSHVFKGSIIYPGTVEAATPDEMYTYLPINETDNSIVGDSLVIRNTEGSLVVGGKEYECHGADNIVATSENDTILAMISTGRLQSTLPVDSLHFRGQEYAVQPIKNFFRDGYFTVITGALTAMIALFARQLLEEFRHR